MSVSVPCLGYGLGLRSVYYQQIIEQSPQVDWFEIVSENYLVQGGKALYYLDAIAERYPLVMHGVSLSIGGPHALDMDYLKQLKQLADRVKPAWVSDHLCWSRGNAHQLHDLLPLPYTEESLYHVAGRVRQVQDVLQRPLVLENVSSYVRSKADEFTEWEFLNALAHLSGCQLLLDVNNVYVSCINHQRDPLAYIDALPLHVAGEIHLAGFAEDTDSLGDRLLIDDHGAPIDNAVWQLYAQVLARTGAVATLIERDNQVPAFSVLQKEARQAEWYLSQVAR